MIQFISPVKIGGIVVQIAATRKQFINDLRERERTVHYNALHPLPQIETYKELKN